MCKLLSEWKSGEESIEQFELTKSEESVTVRWEVTYEVVCVHLTTLSFVPINLALSDRMISGFYKCGRTWSWPDPT